jgi:hypothetical protein
MPILEAATRSAACDAIVDLIDAGGAGTLVFETAGDVAVATITLSATAFGAAASGVATLAGTPLSDTNATGNASPVAQASFFSGAATKILECSVAVSGSDINLSSLTVGAGDTVTLSSLTLTVPA